jgi:DNA-binding transcriptional MerR regulator
VYTVKGLSEIAGVSVRTLHYYDEICLLRPSQVGSNGYRYYDDDALLRLQQILFYREIGLELMQIKDILDRPDFDLLAALRSHRAVLQDKIGRLHSLIATVDDTIRHVDGEITMSKRQLFRAFSAEEQKDYEREARLRWGPQTVNETLKGWYDRSKAEQDAIIAEGSSIYSELLDAMAAGKAADSADVQPMFARWHQHIRYFYEPTLDTLRGLGELYNTDPAFMATFTKLHPDLPAYLQSGIDQYVDDLETAELERMLTEDDAQRSQQG